jgi:hypothetical protein
MIKFSAKERSGQVSLEIAEASELDSWTMTAAQATELALALVSASTQVQSQTQIEPLSDPPLVDLANPGWDTGIDHDGHIVVALKTRGALPPIRFRLRVEKASEFVRHIQEMIDNPAAGQSSKMKH